MLEPVYLRRADWPEVMATIEARLEASQDPDERRPLLKRLANLHEEQTEDYEAALETIAKLLHEDLTDESTWAELERLAKVAGAEERLAEIYAAELDGITTDEAATAKLARRTGELFAKLGETERALHFFRRRTQFEPESRELFDAIDALLVKTIAPKSASSSTAPRSTTATTRGAHRHAAHHRRASSEPRSPSPTARSTPTARCSTSTTDAARSTS